MRTRVTLADVAAEVGVSISTVSRALADNPAVSARTRDRVHEAANRLGLVVNPEARSLSTGRQQAVGLIVPDLRNPFFAHVAKGAQRYARTSEVSVYIHDSNLEPSLEVEAITDLRDEVDGFVLCSPLALDRQLTAALAGTPAVIAHRHVPGIPSVIVDHTTGMSQAADHLRSLGHERIAHVAGPMQSWNAAHRRLAFERVIDGDVLGPRAAGFEGGVAAADALIASGATAVIAYNDMVALGIISRLRVRGLDIPDDISVVGFGNTELAVVTPGLTTINVPRAEAAERAVSTLLDIIDSRHGHSDEVIVLTSHLVMRRTTGPAPVD